MHTYTLNNNKREREREKKKEKHVLIYEYVLDEKIEKRGNRENM